MKLFNNILLALFVAASFSFSGALADPYIYDYDYYDNYSYGYTDEITDDDWFYDYYGYGDVFSDPEIVYEYDWIEGEYEWEEDDLIFDDDLPGE